LSTLYRPVGLHELALIWDSGMREFPPRLSHQPFFYPVVNIEYARHIAAGWNVRDAASGFCGFVTKFGVDDKFLLRFEPKVVGTSAHTEYWIPAEHLREFNRAINSPITVLEAFFGPEFQGHIPDKFGLEGKDAIQQFVAMVRTWDYSRMDFVLEVWTNRKAMYLNSFFWQQADFSKYGVNPDQKRNTMKKIDDAWRHYRIEIPWPVEVL
jgi:hypothetical protein